MLKPIKTKSIYELPKYQKIIIGIVVFILGVVIFSVFPPSAGDWRFTFGPAASIPLSPYSIKTFNYPPWAVLLLYPTHYFSMNISEAINASLSIGIIGLLVIKRKGDVLALFLTLTSYPLLALLANGSLEWIPALGFLFQNGWGLPFLMIKPQSGILAALDWFSSAKNKVLFFVPAILTVVLSFIVWGNWLEKMIESLQYMDTAKVGPSIVNAAPWPWAIPVGLGLLFYILKYKPVNSELLGAVATYCLVPYFVPHSLIISFALLSISHRRLSILCWVLLWIYPVLTHWVIFTQILGFH
jgi:hypothetical protein